jgi:hypothetical protein
MQEVSLFKFLTTGHANQTMQFIPRALSLVLLKSVSVQILGSDKSFYNSTVTEDSRRETFTPAVCLLFLLRPHHDLVVVNSVVIYEYIKPLVTTIAQCAFYTRCDSCMAHFSQARTILTFTRPRRNSNPFTLLQKTLIGCLHIGESRRNKKFVKRYHSESKNITLFTVANPSFPLTRMFEFGAPPATRLHNLKILTSVSTSCQGEFCFSCEDRVYEGFKNDR